MPALDDRTSDGKYVVFKNEEWTAWQPLQGEKPPAQVTNCVVLRFQDRFTVPALWSYVAAIQNTIEVLEGLDLAEAEGMDEEMKGLRDLADKFSDFATMAMETKTKKFPD